LQVLKKFGDVVWHVSWSVTGNILAVSGGDNKVNSSSEVHNAALRLVFNGTLSLADICRCSMLIIIALNHFVTQMRIVRCIIPEEYSISQSINLYLYSIEIKYYNNTPQECCGDIANN